MSNIFLWTAPRDHASVGQSANTYTHQIDAVTVLHMDP